MAKWIEDGVFAALNENYLDEMMMLISDENNQLIESYVYKIKSKQLSVEQNGKETFLTDCTAQTARVQAIQLMRTLISMTNSLQPLPQDRTIRLKLRFNASTPANWTPQHFKREEPCDSLDEFDQIIQLGQVKTTHHAIGVEIHCKELREPTCSEAETVIECPASVLFYLSQHETLSKSQLDIHGALLAQLVMEQVLKPMTGSETYRVIAYDPMVYDKVFRQIQSYPRKEFTTETIASVCSLHVNAAECVLQRLSNENIVEQMSQHVYQLVYSTNCWTSASPLVQKRRRLAF